MEFEDTEQGANAPYMDFVQQQYLPCSKRGMQRKQLDSFLVIGQVMMLRDIITAEVVLESNFRSTNLVRA